MNTKVRNSNIELIRIVAMLFIVTFHISINAQKGELPSHNYIISITTTGVNLFLLITGYFGIRLKWKSILNVLCIIVFYYIVSLVANYLIFKQSPSTGEIISIFTPINRNPWWYMKCYIPLMLLSPGLNVVKEKATEKQYRFLLTTMIFLSCYSGFLLNNFYVNHNGFNLFQFITMYFIGDALKRYRIADFFSKKQWLFIYTVSTVILFFYFSYIDNTNRYNNPVLMFAAISLFCLISKFDIRSSLINQAASYMLPIYLLQDSPFGFKIYNILYSKGVELNFTGWEYYQKLAIYIAALLTLAFILETTRQLLLNKLINNTSKRLKEKVNIFDE